MQRIWSVRELFELREQNLCDQASVIPNNKQLSPVEWESIKRRAFRDTKTNDERKDDEGNADSETMAVNLKEENKDVFEIMDQERDERSEEQISILNGIIDIQACGEQSLHSGF